MTSPHQHVQMIARYELPQFLARWKREKRQDLALCAGDDSVHGFYRYGLTFDATFVLHDSISWDDLKPILACSSLRHLVLLSLKLDAAGARAIAEKLTHLQTLDLSDNNIGAAGARAIAEKLTQLETLTLRRNNIGAAGARAIAERLTSLRELDLSDNNIGEAGARAIAEKLSHLQTLVLSDNNIGAAGARAIGDRLRNLRVLDLNDNNIGEVGARAIGDQLTNLQTLRLNNNNLGDAGARAIAKNLPNLTALWFSHNNVSEAGARAIAEKLTNLKSLWFSDNNVGDSGACAIADQLTSLGVLDLSSNNVGAAGACAIAEQLTTLVSLFLSHNLLTDDALRRLVEGLPQLLSISTFGNESLRLPAELTRGGDTAALRDYFRRAHGEGKRKLNEAKLIVVGNEAVGKTALVNFLINNEPCRDTSKTLGLHIKERIEVTQWSTHSSTPDAEPLRLNVWDFGGQEVTRETHKLFLTARSLYLVVLEARRENVADAENVLHDWMRAIRNRGGDDVPVVVVINKSERDRELRLDETTLKKTYPIRAFIRTSCRDPKEDPDGGKGIVELRQTIIDTIRREIPQASAEFPLSYFEVKEKLRGVAKSEHSFDVVRFTNICRDVKNPVTSGEEQRRLLQLLADIGVVIQHKDTTLLDPNWLTTAIYRLLTHSDVVKRAGLFQVHDLGKLLEGLEGAPHNYPQDRWQYIVDQTVQCGLSFEIVDQPGTYLMPEQLSPNAIDTGLDRFDDPQVLRFRYDYEDIPKGLMPRFIVKMHQYLSKQRTCWANGVVLYVGACKALVCSDRHARWVKIFVHGPANERREALRVVREGLEWVHSLFEEIGPKPMVPVRIPKHPDAAIEHARLIDFERKSLEQYAYEDEVFSVRELLTGIAPVAPIRVTEDRKSDLHIYAGERATVQVITGNDNHTSGSDYRSTLAKSLSPNSPPKPIWKYLAAPIAVSVLTAVLLLMWIQGVEPKRIAMLALPILVGGSVYLTILYREMAARTWARRYAAWCLTLAGASLMAPGVKLLVERQPESKLKLVLDHAPWAGLAFVAAACFFGWVQYTMDRQK